MSIRLRLTLLYSMILALTLVAFSTALYAAQSKVTYDDVKANLIRQAEGIANNPRRFLGPPGDAPQGMNLPGRWTQIRRIDGTVAARTPDLADTTLPLSAEGLRAVQNGASWTETANVDGDPLLIFSEAGLNAGRVVQIVQVAAPIAEREQALNTLRLILLIGSILVILAAFGIGWVLAGTALDPIHRITQTAQAIGSQRDFTRRVNHTGPNDEIGQLATTFNTMLTELESSYRQVEQALLAQRRFVADASHELRTPLTTIRGNIELLRHEPPLEPVESREVLSDAKDEVERLIRLVNQLLVLARADAGRPLRQEPLPLRPLVADVYRQAKLLAPQRNIESNADLDVGVLGDRDALKQVLLILVDNAVAHTPSSASICIRTAQQGGDIAISVRDSGPGIAPNLLPHIFERFYRGDISRSRGGTGLGLAIARELVQAQGGTIDVVSELGKGSEFRVYLKKADGKGEG